MANVNCRAASTGIGVLLIVFCLVTPRVDAETARSRLVMHLTQVDMVEVGDVPGHVLAIGQQMGLTFLEDGEVGTYSGWFTADYTNGSGKHEGYAITTFEDGSTQVTRSEGTTAASEDGKTSEFKGTFTIIGGSGRFEGIQGKGNYTGKRVAPLSAGADGYFDQVSTYTLPSK